MKVQFILKKNEIYSFHHYCRRSSGLWNSVNFVAESLKKNGISVDIVEVKDNNDIDREVTRFRPNLVIIEALWVVPEKFDILKKLHPKVKWFIHLHSHMPFLALEGIAMEWLQGYQRRNIGVIANSWPSYEALKPVFEKSLLSFLPNIYGFTYNKDLHGDYIGAYDEKYSFHVACLGAIRPLKNQLLQALAAIQLATEKKKHLYFYVNASRLETGGEPILKNLRSLFNGMPGTTLIELPWMELDDLLTFLASVDIGLQVSLSETWNHVSANYIDAGVPTVASKEVYWLSFFSKARDDSIDSIVRRMKLALFFKKPLLWWNQFKLALHSRKSSQTLAGICYKGNSMSKKVVVTGSAGFVGSHFVDHILKNTDWKIVGLDSFRHRGDSVRIEPHMDPERYKVYHCDLAAPISERLAYEVGAIDYIVNFASDSHVDRSISSPVPFFQNNTNLMLNVLEYARLANVKKLIQISTDEVYGAAPIGLNHAEWSPILPSNPYSASKAAQEAACIGWWRTFGVPIILTNCMNMFGERQDAEKYIPMCISKISKGEPITIHGNENYIGSRFYIHSRNLADGILFLLREKNPQRYFDSPDEVIFPDRFNVVGEVELNNLEVAYKIAAIMEKKLKFKLLDFHAARPGHDRRYALEGTKIRSTGWVKPLNFDRSLENTVKWFLEHPSYLL